MSVVSDSAESAPCSAIFPSVANIYYIQTSDTVRFERPIDFAMVLAES